MNLALAALPLLLLPDVDFTLKNGLRVRLRPAHDEPEVILLLGVRCGILEEPKGAPHLAHVTEHVAFFSPSEPELLAACERWFGEGRANAETLADFMYFDIRAKKDDLPAALRVQAARLFSPRFDPATVAREAPRALVEIEQLESSPQGGTTKFSWSAFAQAAFHGERAVAMKSGTPKLTAEQVRELHARTFRPERVVLSVIGDFDPAAAKKQIESLFDKPVAEPASKPAGARKLTPGAIDATWDAATSHLIVAWPAPPASDPDHAALTAAATMLTMRLYADAELRPLGTMPMVTNEADRLFLVNVQAKSPDSLAALEKRLLEVVAELAPSAGELDSARMQLRMVTEPREITRAELPPSVSLSLARGNMELQRMMRAMLWGDMTAYGKRLNGLDAAAVRTAASKHLAAKNATIVRLRPQ